MRVKSDFVMRNIMDEYVLVPVGEASLSFGSLLTTNDVGMRIWECLQQDTCKEEIVDTICAEFEAERDVVEKDVEDYLNEIRKIGLMIE